MTDEKIVFLNYIKSGWINLYKPANKTSTQSIGVIRKSLSKFFKENGLMKEKEKLICGHMGTLDPMAEGILPIAFGEATKTIPYHEEGLKEYIFTIKWGEETDTDDATGKIISKTEKIPTIEDIKKTIKSFTGEINQIPSKYSAIHINGIRAYDLARNNQNFQMPSRKIYIKKIKYLSSTRQSKDNYTSTFIVQCSKGTYIRTLCKDIAENLDSKGHLIKLIRTKNGRFEKKESIKEEKLLDFLDKLTENCKNNDNESLINDARIKEVIKPIDYKLDGIPGIEIADEAMHKFQKGMKQACRYQEGLYKIYQASGNSERMKRILSEDKEQRIMIGLGVIDKGFLKVKRVFNIR